MCLSVVTRCGVGLSAAERGLGRGKVSSSGGKLPDFSTLCPLPAGLITEAMRWGARRASGEEDRISRRSNQRGPCEHRPLCKSRGVLGIVSAVHVVSRLASASLERFCPPRASVKLRPTSPTGHVAHKLSWHTMWRRSMSFANVGGIGLCLKPVRGLDADAPYLRTSLQSGEQCIN